MAGEAGFSATLDRAGSWISSLGHKSRSFTSASSGSRVFQPRNTTSIVISKGLLNAPGDNNCFLNSAVQVLWHLDVFRRSFRDMAGHACMGKSCIFCALKVLFTQLQYGEEKALPPDALRKALASAFKDEQRFQLRCMDDAAECFENILVRIHFHLAHDVKEDMCDAKYCVSHQKFAMTLIEHCVCPCGATSEPFPFSQMVHYVSCTALCGEAKRKREKHHLSSAFFGQLLRSAGAIGDVRECPSECGRKIHIRRVLMNCPDVVGIGLVWDSDRPSVDHIMDVISCLGTTLRLPDLFNSVVDEQAKKIALNLVGVVTYYGKHYSTFFYNTKRRLWIYFDDASVKQVGPNWRDVAERCRRGHFQPLLLLFANPNGKAVDIENAPKETTILPGYQHLDSPDQPRVSVPFPSSSYRHSRHSASTIPSTASHSGGSLESTGAVYKSLASVPEFSAKSAPGTHGADKGRTSAYSGLNSVVEIGHDPLGGVPQAGHHSRTEPLSVDGERTLNRSRSLVRENQQRALAMAGFACTKEYEEKSKPAAAAAAARNKTLEMAASRNKTLEMAGFIESSGTPQPLLSGNYDSLYSKKSQVPSRTPEPSNLQGHDEADAWVCADGNMSLPRRQQGVLLPQASQVSKAAARYSQGYRKPQNGGGAPQSHNESVRTMFESDQRRQLVRHKSWNGGTSNGKSVPIYENVVDGVITNDTSDSVEGNETLQSRQSRYGSTPDLKRNLSDSAVETQRSKERGRHTSDNRRNPENQTLGKYDSVPDLQNQLSSVELNGAKKSSLTNRSMDTDIYSSMPDLQRAASNSNAATQKIASKGILADAIKNNEEHRKTLDRIASYSSSSSLTSSSCRGVDSKRSSQASQASTFTTDSADTSRSSGSRSGSLRSKYGVTSGFVTLPRKKRVSDFAEGRSEQRGTPCFQKSNGERGTMQRSHSEPQQPVTHVTPVLKQQNSAPAQFAGVFVEEDDPTPVTVDPRPEGNTARRPSHLQHFTATPVETPKADPLEVGSVGSKDSGYRSRDRSSASSGSVYSVDSPVADTPPMGGELSSSALLAEAIHTNESNRGGVTPTSPNAARKKEVEALCVAVSFDVEELLDKCHQQETAGDLAMALALCTSAVAKLKSTVKLDGISEATRHFLQTKYSMSVVKSRSLHRRLQIIRKQDRMDSIDASHDGRPGSEPSSPTSPNQPGRPAQPTRPASAQPFLSHHSSGNISTRSANMSKYEIQPHHQPTAVAVDLTPNTRVSSHPAFIANGTAQHHGDPRGVSAQQGYAPNGTPSHATDPRTGLYRPHSAQLPRKQYADFSTTHQGQPSNGYHGGDRYRRSSESGQGVGDATWRPGATGRNQPRRSAVEVVTVTHSTNQSQEVPMSDPSSLNPHGAASKESSKRELPTRESSSQELPSRELPSKKLGRKSFSEDSPHQKSSNKPLLASAVHVIHSKPADIHSQLQFSQTPALTMIPKSKLNGNKTSPAICDNMDNSVSPTDDHLRAASHRKNLDHLCSAALENFQRDSVKYNTLPRKWAPKTQRGKPVRYVIEVHGTLKTIPEGAKEKQANGSKMVGSSVKSNKD